MCYQETVTNIWIPRFSEMRNSLLVLCYIQTAWHPTHVIQLWCPELQKLGNSLGNSSTFWMKIKHQRTVSLDKTFQSVLFWIYSQNIFFITIFPHNICLVKYFNLNVYLFNILIWLVKNLLSRCLCCIFFNSSVPISILYHVELIITYNDIFIILIEYD